MATRTPTPAWPRSPRRSPRNSPRAPQRQVPALTCVACRDARDRGHSLPDRGDARCVAARGLRPRHRRRHSAGPRPVAAHSGRGPPRVEVSWTALLARRDRQRPRPLARPASHRPTAHLRMRRCTAPATAGVIAGGIDTVCPRRAIRCPVRRRRGRGPWPHPGHQPIRSLCRKCFRFGPVPAGGQHLAATVSQGGQLADPFGSRWKAKAPFWLPALSTICGGLVGTL
jgi:hypothetical protein